MSYEFQSCLYNTRSALCTAIAGEWLSGGGMNGKAGILEALQDYTDGDLACECVTAWGLDQKRDIDDDQTWMQARDICTAYIRDAFAEIRTDPAAAFGWDEDE